MKSLRDRLLGALVGLARASESKELVESAGAAFIDGLAMAHSTIPHSDEAILAMIDRLHEEKTIMAPDCAACQYPCGRTFDYDMDEVYEASEALREAKLQLLSALGEIASRISEQTAGEVTSRISEQTASEVTSRISEQTSSEVSQFFSDALFQISCTYEPGQLAGPLETAEKLLKRSFSA